MIVEFNKQESLAFDEVMEVLKRYPDFEYMQMNDDSILSVPGLEIYPTYMNQIFPFMGVRFIAVNDHYDSRDHAGT